MALPRHPVVHWRVKISTSMCVHRHTEIEEKLRPFHSHALLLEELRRPSMHRNVDQELADTGAGLAMRVNDLVNRLERLLALNTQDFLHDRIGDGILEACGLEIGAQSPAVSQTVPFLVFQRFAT